MNMSDNVHPHVNTGWIAGPTVHPYGGLDGPTLVAPANNSWFAMGNITFTWNSINTNIGWSNYTLQISQDINFTTLAYNNGSVVGTAGTTTITLPLTLERSWVAGLYYWRVQPHVNNTYWGSWSDTWRFSLQANTTAPVLSQGKVEPNGGTSATLLRFTVLYSDIDNNAPLFVRVVINGASYPMAKQDTTDSVYVEEGCVYELAMYLEAGSYEYRFTCGDMTGTADTPAQSFQVTPGSPPGLPVPVPGQPTMEEWITAFVVLGIIAGVAALLVVLATREGGFKKPTLSKPRRPSLSTKTPKTKRPAAGPEFVTLDDDASKAAVPGVKPKPVQKPSGVQKPAPAQGSVLRCPHCKSSWQLTPEQFAMYKGKETDCTSCGKKFVPQ